MLFRIFVLILTMFTLASTNGQNLSFDEKVEQLFFNINVSKRTALLVSEFSEVNWLLHTKPGGYTSQSLGHKGWFHSFQFTTHPYLKQIDTGFIEIRIDEYPDKKIVSDIWWKSTFNSKLNAFAVFNKLKKYFTSKTVVSKIYKSEWAIETAEFTDTTASKYPNIMFMLSDNKNLEKKFQIVFMLDNDVHHEE